MPYELITLEEAKRHLRIIQQGFDDEVISALEAATKFCEGWTGRTLRTSTERTLSFDSWWSGQLGIPNPPLIAITEIKYWIDDVDTVLDAENYRAIVSAEGQGWIEWTEDSEQPDHDARSDAVRITYTAGYTLENFPATAKYAILLKLTELWGDTNGRNLENAGRSCKDFLYAVDWGHYV